MLSRLTSEYGECMHNESACVIDDNCTFECLRNQLEEMAELLSEYENTGLSPKEIELLKTCEYGKAIMQKAQAKNA